jgi:glycosyltransferase involved in cell wall biosynthesis
MPVRYVTVLLEAIRYGAIVDFLLAAYFASGMKQVDAIYATFGDHKLYVGYFSKRLFDKPLAVSIHSSEMYFNPIPRLFAVALRACDQIISVTEYNRDQLCRRFHFSPEQIEVIRLSVDLDEYRPASKFVILIVAHFGETKGHEILFKAVKRLGYDDVEVWVVGGHDGREPVDVPELARRIGVESQVAFFGKLSGTALRAVYHACDVFCLPCRNDSEGGREGFPSVLMEAMAYGKPVVTTRHTEIPRIVEQVLTNENDVDGLVEALRLVYASSSLRKRLGERGRELAEEHFSTDNVSKTLEVLRRISSLDARGSERSDLAEIACPTLDRSQRMHNEPVRIQ